MRTCKIAPADQGRDFLLIRGLILYQNLSLEIQGNWLGIGRGTTRQGSAVKIKVAVGRAAKADYPKIVEIAGVAAVGPDIINRSVSIAQTSHPLNTFLGQFGGLGLVFGKAGITQRKNNCKS